jgi:hypothetical protein
VIDSGEVVEGRRITEGEQRHDGKRGTGWVAYCRRIDDGIRGAVAGSCSAVIEAKG